MKNKITIYLRHTIFIVLACAFLTSCQMRESFPRDKVFEGNGLLIIYKVEKIKNDKYGDYKYGILDATEHGWTLKSFEKFSVGDTLRITNKPIPE